MVGGLSPRLKALALTSIYIVRLFITHQTVWPVRTIWKITRWPLYTRSWNLKMTLISQRKLKELLSRGILIAPSLNSKTIKPKLWEKKSLCAHFSPPVPHLCLFRIYWSVLFWNFTVFITYFIWRNSIILFKLVMEFYFRESVGINPI